MSSLTVLPSQPKIETETRHGGKDLEIKELMDLLPESQARALNTETLVVNGRLSQPDLGTLLSLISRMRLSGVRVNGITITTEDEPVEASVSIGFYVLYFRKQSSGPWDLVDLQKIAY